jgi:hypothetical protein
VLLPVMLTYCTCSVALCICITSWPSKA